MKAFQTLDTEGQGFLTQEQLTKLMMEEGRTDTRSTILDLYLSS